MESLEQNSLKNQRSEQSILSQTFYLEEMILESEIGYSRKQERITI